MPDSLDLVVRGIAMGVTGSALMDLWSAVLRRRFGIPTLDYRLLGRWIGGFRTGRFVHDPIATAPPVRGERALGWAAHYAIGVGFAFLLLVISGPAWPAAPTPGPALAVGIGTIVAPWLVMQPAMGIGIAASRSPNPVATRLRNLGTHTVYGVGLYVAAAALAAASPG
jgi:Protein of unknown function (DUF2938)